ncbi:transglutaminase family protein [Sphingomonas quercus]|uniref:Transglutaminase family protein n=1 Tax=Sphingomonas quercus TaxID=2842451 RepID=A0ABS6BIB3_9SPHN|nr:transglutaminase family protein [Sphingomonas quercus]MBU3078047.1 transglutaminase family protein [Sphingomonas quercus]
MIYEVTHSTTFDYDAPMRYARCNLRLEPIDWPGQSLLSFSLHVAPEGPISPSHVAAYAGHIARMVVEQPVTELVITARARLSVNRVAALPAPDDPSVAGVARAAVAVADLGVMSPANYIYPSPMIALTPDIAAWCADSLSPGRGIVEAAYELTSRIKAAFRYDGAATETDTTPAEAFDRRAGVCQDFAQVMIAGLRAAGLPAAYVSGYLRTIPPAGKPRLIGADATHAWVMLWCGPARGWLGFDPTNGVGMNADHILTAIGRDYADIAPIDGIFVGQSGQSIKVSVDVAPIE